MKPFLRYWPVLLLPAFLVGKSVYDRQQQEIGRLNADLYRNRAKVDTLQRRVQKLADSIRVRTQVYYRTRTRWDTLPLLVPGLQLANAPAVPAQQLANVILLGQETINACQSALSPCMALIPAKDSIIALQRQELAIIRRRVPNRWDGLREWIIRGAIFYVGTRIR